MLTWEIEETAVKVHSGLSDETESQVLPTSLTAATRPPQRVPHTLLATRNTELQGTRKLAAENLRGDPYHFLIVSRNHCEVKLRFLEIVTVGKWKQGLLSTWTDFQLLAEELRVASRGREQGSHELQEDQAANPLDA